MTQEDKELLLKDLCGRLPYRMKVKTEHGYETLECIDCFDLLDIRITTDNDDDNYSLDEIKPYLFPLSSMTEGQRKEFDRLLELELKALNYEIDHIQATAFEVDFYHKHHLDWRGLIPMGLAIDATGLNIY